MITIDRGVYTSINIRVAEDVDFTYIEKIVFTLKNNVRDKAILVFDIFDTGDHILKITPDQSKLIRESAVYDFDLITKEGERYKITENDKIIIREGAGNSYD